LFDLCDSNVVVGPNRLTYLAIGSGVICRFLFSFSWIRILIPLMFICRLKMDSLSTLVVRFYFGGQFYNNDQIIKYCDDRQAISYIYRDHVSLAEIVGHAQDHCVLKEGNLLHWLFQEGIS
jgi:hypothetical protein